MKLQKASRKEIKRVALGTLALDGIMIAGFWFLSQFGIGRFELLPIILAACGGTVIAVLNFTLLCITVQQAVEIEDRKKMQARFQLSYNIRMVTQAGWVVICFFAPALHIFAGALPLVFPKLTILFLQATGRLIPKEEGQQSVPEEAGEAEE